MGWNKIIIRPIGKNNNPKVVSETRPITNNSVMTEIITSVLNDQIRDYMENGDILTNFQSGFRTKHSCMTALIRVNEDIRTNIAKNKLKIMVLLDIKSAYPSVSHQLLFHVLNKYGFNCDSIKWVESFLANKTQYVEIDGKTSDQILVDCGLLQGDNL